MAAALPALTVSRERRPKRRPQGEAKRKAALKFLTSISLDGTKPFSGPEIAEKQGISGGVAVGNDRAANVRQDFRRKRSVSLSESPKKSNATPLDTYSRFVSVGGSYGAQGESGPRRLARGVEVFPPNTLEENAITGQRVMVCTHGGMPFAMFSVLQYFHDDGRQRGDGPERQLSRNQSTGDDYGIVEGVRLGTDKQPVSYRLFLEPLIVQGDAPSSPPPYRRLSMSEDVEGDVIIARPQSDDTQVLCLYRPLALDDPRLHFGRRCTVMPLKSYSVSLLEYADPHAIKKDVNEQFHNRYPRVHLTLTKLRSLKREMLELVDVEGCGIELGTIALAFVYFEKLILMGKINKANRKICAGVCVLLAAKFGDVCRNCKALLEAITDKFRVSRRALLVAEVPALVALQFSLVIPSQQVFPHYQHLLLSYMTR